MPTKTIATADRFIAILVAVSIAQRLRATASKADTTSAQRTALKDSAREFEEEAARLGR